MAGCHGNMVIFAMYAVLTRAFSFLCSVSRRQSVRRMTCSFLTVCPRLPAYKCARASGCVELTVCTQELRCTHYWHSRVLIED